MMTLAIVSSIGVRVEEMVESARPTTLILFGVDAIKKEDDTPLAQKPTLIVLLNMTDSDQFGTQDGHDSFLLLHC